MKNVRVIYVHLVGDVYARYEVSARTREEASGCVLEVLSEKARDGKNIIVPKRGTIPYVGEGTPKKVVQAYNQNGTYTREGVLCIVESVADALAFYAQEVWENIDPRCGAKVPSRLYRNVAHICADVLTRLGIPAKVSLLKLNPEKNYGLRNQYRVTVTTRTPKYPWTRELAAVHVNDGSKMFRAKEEWDSLEFDFDVTNQLRIAWTWAGYARISGMDVRVLRDGKPVRWVGMFHKVLSDEKIVFKVQSGSNVLYPDTNAFELFMMQSSFKDILAQTTDGSIEQIQRAVVEAFKYSDEE